MNWYREIVAVDVDGTLTERVCWTDKEVLEATPKQEIIDCVNKLYEKKLVIIYTARQDFLIPATLRWLRNHGVKYHAFSNQKLPADYYLDDHAVHIDDLDKIK